MVASPAAGKFDPDKALLDRIATLETAVKNLTNKTLYSVSVGSGGITMAPGGAITDQNGNILLQSDPAGGLARPYWPIPMYMYGQPENPNTSTGEWGANAIRSDVLQSIGSASNWWTGHIPIILHPRLEMTGVFGPGSGTHTQTINLYIADSSGNETLLWTNNYTTLTDPVSTGPLDITELMGQQSCRVRLRTSVTGTATNDGCALHIYAVYLRGSLGLP